MKVFLSFLLLSGVGASFTKKKKKKGAKRIYQVHYFFFSISPSDGYVLENRYEVVAKNRMASQQQGLYIIVNNSQK